jgi:hypothetical protein
MLNREGRRFGTRVALHEDYTLTLHWRSDNGDLSSPVTMGRTRSGRVPRGNG